MEQVLKKLLESGVTVEDIHQALRTYVNNETIKCSSCRRKLGQKEDGILTIKCRCGEYNQIL